jgi:hypothetical protein
MYTLFAPPYRMKHLQRIRARVSTHNFFYFLPRRKTFKLKICKMNEAGHEVAARDL